MNILLLSVGTRNKIVQYFKKELCQVGGKVIATDCSKYAPALYEADKYYIVPRMIDEGYIDVIYDICKKENISAVLSLIDPELSLIAKNKDSFRQIGVTPIISDYDKVEMCLDKYRMYRFLKDNKINTPKSYLCLNEFYQDIEKHNIEFPVFVKPVKGSASINISRVDNKNQLESMFNNNKDIMIQEFMDGQEYGADVYIDMITKKVVSIFVKEKLKMRAGETDKGISIKDEKLFKLIEKFVNIAGFTGIIDIDIFKKYDKYYISEVNPRFGGGYPHAYESGVNVPKRIINNLNGIANKKDIGNYDDGIVMMKYNEVKIIKNKI